MEDFEAVIGLEVHAQLATDSKIFATSSTVSGNEPNTQTDPLTLALPGSLPVLNRRVVDYAIKLGLATESNVRLTSVFARKHYFYPDLPKGYQISQFDKPICENGQIAILVDGERRYVKLTRIHLEEDAGKNTHMDHEGYSVVDLNRAGVPLVEIVSEPDMRSAKEAGEYMRRIRQIVRYLDICDGNMEQGSLRCDANVSVRRRGEARLGTKVEIKNLNSFRFVEKALEFEIARQIEMVKHGQEIVQETRLWDEAKNVTKTMRTKETAQDYRYFPDPDLPPLVLTEKWIEKMACSIPELPLDVYERFVSLYGIEPYFADLLSDERIFANYFDNAVGAHNNPKALANWITSELFGRLNKENVDMSQCPISPENLANLVRMIDDGVISGKIAKVVFDEMFTDGASPQAIVERKGLLQVSDRGELEGIIKEIVAGNLGQVEEYLGGKKKVMGFFVGQVMKATEGKANPGLVNEILQAEIAEVAAKLGKS